MKRPDKLAPAVLLANAARKRQQARQEARWSYHRAWAISEARLWLILAHQQLSQRKETGR